MVKDAALTMVFWVVTFYLVNLGDFVVVVALGVMLVICIDQF